APATQEAEAALDRLTEKPGTTVQRLYEGLAGRDHAAIARAVLAMAGNAQETTQFFADEVKKKTQAKPAPKELAKPRDEQELLKAELEALARKRAELRLMAALANPNVGEQPAGTVGKEIITRRVGFLLEQIGTPEAKQLLESIQEKKIFF